MMLYLDHIVFSGMDIEKLSEKYANEFQVTTVTGDKHENWGTYNHLAYFANHCYIEWLGIKDWQIARMSENPLIQHVVYMLENEREDAFQFALRTNRLDDFVGHFIDTQISFIGPVEGKRKKPNGELLTWRMLFPKYDFKKETLPFLIEWNQTEAERIDSSLVNNGKLTELYFGGTDIERFTQIYGVRSKKNTANTIALENMSIFFSDQSNITFTKN